MNLDPSEISRLLPFEERYERRRQRWYDGPHGSWEAFDRVIEREVILNIAWAYSNIPGFIRSAKVASSLRHPNFLPVYDLGLVGGETPFYTTPPVREMPLSHFLREFEENEPRSGRGFPLLPLAGAMGDTCRALDYAHHRGLLHLDLHPDSLLVGKDFHVILDVVGWAGMPAGEGGDAGEFRIVGRPSYMSPEQVTEAGPGIGPGTDVFGLGGILHYILFGTPPNRLSGSSNAMQMIKAIAEGAHEPRRPATLRPGIRFSADRSRVDQLVGICLKALAHDPKARFPTAASMAEAIDEFAAKSRSAWKPWPWRR